MSQRDAITKSELENMHIKDQEAEQLTSGLVDAYEQLALLYRVAEHVGESASAWSLTKSTLEQLVGVLPAETITYVSWPTNSEGRVSQLFGNPAFLTAGCPNFGEDSFRRVVEELSDQVGQIPLVLNTEEENTSVCQVPGIRNLILLPMVVENETVGWVGAINHAEQEWFGTVQAKLLNAVVKLIAARELTDRANHMRHIAESANRLKSNLLANVSHEFRTPLNGIMSFSRVLLDENDTATREERRDYAETIYGCSERLLELVENILEYSDLDSGNTPVQRIPCVLREIIAVVVSESRIQAEHKSIELTAADITAANATVFADPVRLRQLLTILIRNAVKFTNQGTVCVDCEIVFTNSKRQLCVTVSDTGVGIPPDRIDDIFDPFIQADDYLSRRHGGLGLGLPICRRLADSLGLTLAVESKVGRGSTFSVLFDEHAFSDTSESQRFLDAAQC